MAKLHTLALSRLPLVGQTVLANHPDPQIRTLLAKSPTTDISVIEKLVNDSNSEVYCAALNRTANTKLIRKMLTKLGYLDRKGLLQPIRLKHSNRVLTRAVHAIEVALARNPLTPPEVLAQILQGSIWTPSLHAAINPATPEPVRREHISNVTLAIAMERDSVTQSLKDSFVHEIVVHNPWVANSPGKLDNHLKNVISTAAKGAQNCAATADIEELLQTRTVEAYALVIKHPHLTQDQAGQILTDIFYNDGDDVHAAGVHAIGHLVNRYGITVLPDDVSDYGSGVFHEYLATARWLAPVLDHRGGAPNIYQQEDLEEAADILDANQRNWEAYVTLLDDWYSNYTRCAETATMLSETTAR